VLLKYGDFGGGVLRTSVSSVSQNPSKVHNRTFEDALELATITTFVAVSASASAGHVSDEWMSGCEELK